MNKKISPLVIIGIVAFVLVLLGIMFGAKLLFSDSNDDDNTTLSDDNTVFTEGTTTFDDSSAIESASFTEIESGNTSDNEESTVTVPNVVGYSSSEAILTLKNAELKALIKEQNNSDIAKDFVISQSPKANTTQKRGTQIILIISKGTEAVPTTEKQSNTAPDQINWSTWADSLPSYVSSAGYYIEERTLYRSRELETTSSAKSSMEGWELYNTASSKGDYGPWSEWSQNVVSKSDTKDVQSEIRYRFSDKETTTGSSSSKSGWTLEETTYSWSNYGAWSDWSTTYVSNSDSRKVESKIQYRYRDISYSTEYSSWGEWSDWTPDYVSGNDTRDVQTATIYGYYYFQCPNCGKHWHGWNFNCFSWDGGCGAYIPEGSWHQMWSNVSWDQSGLYDFHGTGKYATNYFGERWFKWSNDGQPRTGYRYRTRSSSQVKKYGSWSGWSDNSYSSSSTREVETRTVYRYCDRSKVATYHFYRWKDWSAWSTDYAAQSDSRKVQVATFYRFRDRVNQTMYYYRRWSEWSPYSNTYVAASDTKQVQSKTQYRFKSK